MSYLVNLKLDGRRALVVGAGAVALRKVRGLIEAGADVTVVAIRSGDEIRQMAASGALALHERAYEGRDLDGAFLVVAATDDEDLNARIAAEAQAAGILVNVVDRPAHCTFTVPAVVRRGRLTVAVATDGRCPAFSRILREDLEATFGPEYAQVLEVMGGLRDRLMERGWPSGRIQRTLEAAYREGLREVLASGDGQRLEAYLQRFLDGEA